MYSRPHGGNVPPPHGESSGKDVGGVSRSTSSVATTTQLSNVPPPGPPMKKHGIVRNPQP